VEREMAKVAVPQKLGNFKAADAEDFASLSDGD
jgi:hypothetical protein